MRYISLFLFVVVIGICSVAAGQEDRPTLDVSRKLLSSIHSFFLLLDSETLEDIDKEYEGAFSKLNYIIDNMEQPSVGKEQALMEVYQTQLPSLLNSIVKPDYWASRKHVYAQSAPTPGCTEEAGRAWIEKWNLKAKPFERIITCPMMVDQLIFQHVHNGAFDYLQRHCKWTP